MVEVVLLSSEGCHLCSDARLALAQITLEFPVSVREVDLASEEGRALNDLHRPSMPPAVLLGGKLFSVGRLPQKKLRRLLEARAA